MKQTAIIAGIMGLTIFTACNTHSESEEYDQTEEMNDDRFVEEENRSDAEFMVEVMAGSLREIELAEIAMEHTSSDEVKEFANMMIREHQNIVQQLDSIAQITNATLPDVPDDEAVTDMNKLTTKKRDKDFDETYMRMTYTHHQNQVKFFEKELEQEHNKYIKEWAQQTLTTINRHLTEAEPLYTKFSPR